MTPSTPTNDRGTPAVISLPAPVRAGAFWLAVLLPFCALAMMITGLATTAEYVAFASLVLTNVVALVVGHGYGDE